MLRRQMSYRFEDQDSSSMALRVGFNVLIWFVFYFILIIFNTFRSF